MYKTLSDSNDVTTLVRVVLRFVESILTDLPDMDPAILLVNCVGNSSFKGYLYHFCARGPHQLGNGRENSESLETNHSIKRKQSNAKRS